MSRRRWSCLFLSLAMALLSGCGWLGVGRQAATEVRFDRDRDRMERIARQVLEQGDVYDVSAPPGWAEVQLYGQAVEFDGGSAGFGADTSCWGVSYMPEDVPVGFRGLTGALEPEGDGWSWQEPEGDDRCHVVRLAPCWYYWEMCF